MNSIIHMLYTSEELMCAFRITRVVELIELNSWALVFEVMFYWICVGFDSYFATKEVKIVNKINFL